jgi:hypothetical protein
MSEQPTVFQSTKHQSVPAVMRTTYQDDAEIDRPFTGKMHVMDESGDTKVIWDSKNEDEVAAARKTFNDLKKKGYVAYSVAKDGEKDKVINEFDETAERIIMARPIRGG